MAYGYGQPYGIGAQPRHLDFVAGEQGADAFYVGPGETVALFDTESATMWVKSADQSGVCSKVAYDIAEREPEPAPEYVTKADFEDFKNEILEAMTSGK